MPEALSRKLLKQVQEQQEEEFAAYVFMQSLLTFSPLPKEKKQKVPVLELETPVESEDEEPEQEFFEGNEITVRSLRVILIKVGHRSF